MDKRITFSIIIPSLNQGEFIESAIDSVLNQIYPQKEIIVIDGGSKDDTIRILKKYNKKITWISEPDRGQSHAINKGFELASSTVISWLNSDDVLYPKALEMVSSKFIHQPDLDLLYGDCDYIDFKGKVIQSYPVMDFDYATYVEGGFNFIPQPAAFFKRHLFTSVGKINEMLHYAMDYEYWLRVAKMFRVGYLPSTLAALRVHKDAKSIKDRGNFSEELIEIYERVIQGDKNLTYINKQKAMVNIYYRAAHIAYWSNSNHKSFQYAKKAFELDRYKPTRLLFQCLLAYFGINFSKLLKNPYTLDKFSNTTLPNSP